MALSITPLGQRGIEVEVRGKLGKDDYRQFASLAEQRLKSDDTIDLLIRVSDFEGFSPAALWEDLKFDVAHYGDVSRLALVSDGANAKWMAQISKPFTRARVEHFDETELEAARQWVGGSG